ncbi:MAG: hypothetical protein ACM3RP_10980 [Chitinophagales bacterium]
MSELAEERASEAEAPTKLEEAVEMIRQASRAGLLVPRQELLASLGDGEDQGEGLPPSEEEPDLSAYPDIRRLEDGDAVYFYSDLHMTDRYAGIAAKAASGDLPRLIADTVRFDSETYPRPTPIETFGVAPYLLTLEELRAALAQMGKDPAYADIKTVYASNGAEFLYSETRLGKDHAEGLAEWIAVGQFDSP